MSVAIHRDPYTTLLDVTQPDRLGYTAQMK